MAHQLQAFQLRLGRQQQSKVISVGLAVVSGMDAVCNWTASGWNPCCCRRDLPSRGQRGSEGLELLGGQWGEKHINGGKLKLPPQHPWLPPGLITFQRHQPCPGFAVL